MFEESSYKSFIYSLIGSHVKNLFFVVPWSSFSPVPSPCYYYSNNYYSTPYTPSDTSHSPSDTPHSITNSSHCRSNKPYSSTYASEPNFCPSYTSRCSSSYIPSSSNKSSISSLSSNTSTRQVNNSWLKYCHFLRKRTSHIYIASRLVSEVLYYVGNPVCTLSVPCTYTVRTGLPTNNENSETTKRSFNWL